MTAAPASLAIGDAAPGDDPAGSRERLPELRLRHSIPISIAGQMAYVLSQMGVLMALAHFRGPAAVGEFGLALALTTPAFMFAHMGGRSSQASDVAQKYSFAEYAGLMIAIAVLATVASIAAGAAFTSTTGTFLIVVVVALTKAVEAISTLAYGAYQQAGRADKMAWSLLLRGLFTVGLFTLVLALGAPTGLAFLAQLTVWSVLALFRDYPLASNMADGRLVWPSRDVRRIRALARETFPLGASYVVNSLLVSLPRLFVERYVGLSALGLLTVVTYIQQAGSMLFTAMSQTLVNRIARLRLKGQDKAIRRTLRTLFVFVTLCCAAGMAVAILAGERLLDLVFGPEFGAAHALLVLVTVALCARLYGVIPQSLMHAQRRFGAFLYREIAAVAVCAAALVVCVPRWGLMGAGYAIVVAAVFRLAIMCVATMAMRNRAQSEPRQ